ncbi:hypothetical protein NPIL_80521 [Nephila pilipes]|uniref:Uncharacterized protein n=1 Tax=Nephila pilipes TaxID=299642 RepID=A0A8X6IYZ1_NEPPI|nr:hypothetical protein NPIL_80521 [Nephila pilipes]
MRIRTFSLDKGNNQSRKNGRDEPRGKNISTVEKVIKLSKEDSDDPVSDILNDPFPDVNESDEETDVEGSLTDVPQEEYVKKEKKLEKPERARY